MIRIEETIKDEIIKELREELEYVEGSHEAQDYYSQWVMGVSIKGLTDTSYLCRTVIKTSESDYVDGTDIIVNLVDHKAEIDLSYVEETPLFHGGEVTPAIKWLEELKGLVGYIRLLEPKDIKINKDKELSKKDEKDE